MKTRSTFRRRKNGPDNSAYFGYRAAQDPRNAAFFGPYEIFVAACNVNREHNRTLPLATKHQPNETGRQLAARLRAEGSMSAPKTDRRRYAAVSVSDETPTKPKRVRAKKAAA